MSACSAWTGHLVVAHLYGYHVVKMLSSLLWK